MRKKVISLVGSAVLVAALAVPAIAGVTPDDRCDFVDGANGGETGNRIRVSVNALRGHPVLNPGDVPQGAKKVTICHYDGHQAANGRQDEVVIQPAVIASTR